MNKTRSLLALLATLVGCASSIDDPRTNALSQALTCAPSRVQSAAVTGNGTQCVTLPTAPVSGHRIVLWVRQFGGAGSVTGATGAAFTLAISHTDLTKLYAFTGTANGGRVLCATAGDPNDWLSVYAEEWTNLGALDAFATHDDGYSHAPTAGPITTSTDTVVFASSSGSTWGLSSTPDPGWTLDHTWDNGFSVISAALAAGTFNPRWTLSGDSTVVHAISLALAVACDGPPPPDLAMPVDFTVPPRDLAGAPAPDLAMVPPPADLAQRVDLAQAPPPVDLARSPDLVQVPHPDLAGICADPIESPVTTAQVTFARIKSPGPRMHFTAGLPFRVLADAVDIRWSECGGGPCPDWLLSLYDNGNLIGTANQWIKNENNHWEFRYANGLAAGTHTLTCTWHPHNVATVPCDVPVTIVVDPGTITLNSDVVLTGSTDYNCEGSTIVGNGHVIRSAQGHSGNVRLRRCHVTGLGDYGVEGIAIDTTGSVLDEDNIYEATGTSRFGVTGTGGNVHRRNEWRANNLLEYVAANPLTPIAVQLDGVTSGAKIFDSNRVAGGMVYVKNSAGWQVTKGVGIGPRVVLAFENAQNAVVRGNYNRHDYAGGWSQGFNLYNVINSINMLAEHNILRASSWPVQGMCGEFRYNFVVESGHDWFRDACPGTKIHRNVFFHPGAGDTQFGGGLMFLAGNTGLDVGNNTFDGGGRGIFTAPVIVLGPTSSLQRFNSNAIVGFSDPGNVFSNAFVTHAQDYPLAGFPQVNADYNLWWNPGAPNTTPYVPGIISGLAANDRTQDPKFTAPSPLPYAIPEGCLWDGQTQTDAEMAKIRAVYTPAPGSPLIDTGDPADGPGNDRGAVGAGVPNALDNFGRP